MMKNTPTRTNSASAPRAQPGKTGNPYSAVLGHGVPGNQAPGAGTPVGHVTIGQPRGTKSGSTSPSVHRLPGAGNW